MDIRFFEEGNAYVTERRPPLFVSAFVALLLLFTIGTMFAGMEELPPFYLVVLPLLATLWATLLWFSASYRETTRYAPEVHHFEREVCYFGSTRKARRIAVGGYDEVLFGLGRIASGSVGGRIQYVLLDNGNRDCTFEIASVTREEEAERIAGEVSRRIGLPARRVEWNEDPTFINGGTWMCKHIRRTR